METVMTQKVLLGIAIAWMAMAGARGTMEADEKDCADELGSLAACIPFVSGTAKKPTPECCADTQKVKADKPKCLCVLIKQSTDPSMGLPVNTTLALQMPSLCHIDASVSNCPSILNIPADSPDAKIFKEADQSGSSTSSTDSAPSSSSSKPAPSSNHGSKIMLPSIAAGIFLTLLSTMTSIYL